MEQHTITAEWPLSTLKSIDIISMATCRSHVNIPLLLLVLQQSPHEKKKKKI